VINGELIGLPSVIPAVDPPELFSLDFLLPHNQFSPSSLLARRACLRNIDAWLAGIRPEDWALFMMLATQGDLGFIPLEMSHYRVHAAGGWSRISRHHRDALTVRMLTHVMGLLSGKDLELVESVKSSLATSWSSELVANALVSIEAVTNELNGIADSQLSNYLLASVVAVARAKAEGIDARDANIAQLSERVEALSTTIAQMRECIAARDVSIGAFQAEISDFRQTSSWRLTAPLRFAVQLARSGKWRKAAHTRP
jgi:hypothetical protein